MATAHRGTAGALLWCHAASLLVGCVIAIHLLTPFASATSTGRVSGEYINSLFWSRLYDIAVIDSNAYCGTGLGLAVIDLFDPAHPRWRADYYLGGAGHLIAASGHYVYLVHYSTIFVFDVSNPSELVLLSQLPVGGRFCAIDVSGGILAAVDNWYHYIDFVDVSDPAAPRVLGKYQTHVGDYGLTGLDGIAIHDSIVYATIGSAALQTIDISNPAQPVVLGTDSIAVRSLEIEYPYLYGFHPFRAQGLLVWDVSDPTQPRMVFQDSGAVTGVMVEGNRAYVQDRGTLRIMDVTNPTAPRTIAEKVHGGWPVPVAMVGSSGNLVALAAEPGLRVIDVADTVNVPEVGSFRFDNSFTRVKSHKELLFAIMRRSGELHVFDIQNREMPVLMGTMPELGPVFDFVIRNDTMYTSGFGVHAVDVSSPSQPQVLGEIETDTTYRAISVKDTLVYIAKSFGMDVINFSDIVNPSLISTYSVTDHTYQYGGACLEMAGDIAYMDCWVWVGRQDQARIVVKVDVSDPTRPTSAGWLGLGESLCELRIRSGIGYALADEELRIVDLSASSGQPPIFNSIQTGGPNTGITLHEDMAYVGRSWGGIAVVDVSDPVRADTIGSYDPGAGGTAYLAIVDSFAYIAAEYGLVVAKMTISPAAGVDSEVLPEAFQLEQNYPNPFNAGTSIRYAIPKPGPVNLSVFNILGRHVATLVDATQPAGTHIVPWDGRNAQGQEMGSGVYFYRLRFIEGETSRKMLLLK